MPTKTKREMGYWTYANNVDGALRNGSFIRQGPKGLAQYMNGDFMGFLDAVPAKGYAEVTKEYAEKLIPKVCK